MYVCMYILFEQVQINSNVGCNAKDNNEMAKDMTKTRCRLWSQPKCINIETKGVKSRA